LPRELTYLCDPQQLPGADDHPRAAEQSYADWPPADLRELRRAVAAGRFMLLGEAAVRGRDAAYRVVGTTSVYLRTDFAGDKPYFTPGYSTYYQVFNARGHQVDRLGDIDRGCAPQAVKMAAGLDFLCIPTFLDGETFFELGAGGRAVLLASCGGNEFAARDGTAYEVREGYTVADVDHDGISELIVPAAADWQVRGCFEGRGEVWIAKGACQLARTSGEVLWLDVAASYEVSQGYAVLGFPELTAPEPQLRHSATTAWWSAAKWQWFSTSGTYYAARQQERDDSASRLQPLERRVPTRAELQQVGRGG
jgi:hypothetical protein